jgi:hypothetical protein
MGVVLLLWLQVSYVLDTEDVLYRQQRSQKQASADQVAKLPDPRVPKWQRWLEQRCAAIGAAPAPAAQPAEVPTAAS